MHGHNKGKKFWRLKCMSPQSNLTFFKMIRMSCLPYYFYFGNLHVLKNMVDMEQLFEMLIFCVPFPQVLLKILFLSFQRSSGRTEPYVCFEAQHNVISCRCGRCTWTTKKYNDNDNSPRKKETFLTKITLGFHF